MTVNEIVKECLEILKAVEWAGLSCYGSAAACPYCDEEESSGKHAPDCKLQKFLVNYVAGDAQCQR